MTSYIDSLSSSMIERRLEELKEVPARDPLRASSGRARFLREAAEYQQAVPVARPARQSGWISFLRKEKVAMTAFVSFILAFIFVLSGGATVAAAQDDLPNQALYPLKLWTEDATLAMTRDPLQQAEQLMNMAQTRVEEMAALAEKGVTPPDRVRARLETHLRQALMLAADMDEAGLQGTLLQIREHLQKQDRLMQRLQEQAGAGIEPQLTRTRQMLQLNLQLAEQGLADPEAFRHTMRNKLQHGPLRQGEPGFHQPTRQPNRTPGPGNGNGNCNGNGSPCGPNPEAPKDGDCGNGPCGEEPGGHHPDEPKDGHGDGSDHERPGGPNEGSAPGGDNGGEGGSGGHNSGGDGSGGDNGGGGDSGGGGNK